MADYWKKKLEELNQSTKKTSSTTKTSSYDYWKTKLDELDEEEEKQKAVAPVKSAAKKEEEDKPLLMKAIDKVGDFLDNSAEVAGKILTGDIFKKEDKDIAPTVSTETKAEQKDDDDGKFTLKDAASWAGNAAMSGLASFNKGITSTADLLLGKPLQSLGWENNPVSKMADYYDDQYTAWKNETAEDAAKLGGGKGLSIAGDIIESTVAAVPNALAALMSAGASLGASATSTGLQQAALYDSGNLLTKIGMKVTDMAKNPQYWTSFVQTYGTDYEEAKAMGASDTAALYGATISSLLNAGVEIGVDGLSGIQGLPAKVMNGDKGAFLEWVESSLSEGGEEMVQGVITNIVSKVMYDEDTKVFDAKEMLTDAAMGTAVGGLLGGGQIAAVKGADAVTEAIQTHEDNKLTENEQKVVDKVVEDRIAEAEKDGEKLTAKEKNEIHEEVENDLEKGYIPTDTIEEVLGGETYAEYKNTTDSENALREEFETLGAMKKSDFTAKQDDRYNELKQKLAEIDSGDARNQLKTKLSQEVSALAEGSRLAESYNERGRRGEKFDADLTAYDEKQKAVVQKAIDSGILNNTNRTHEFVDMVAKISADKGVLFDFTNNEKLKGSGFAVDGKTVNGFVNKDGVTVNIDSAKSLNSVVGHEITHVLEGTELYTELQNAVVEYAKSKGDYQGRYDSLVSLYQGIEGADIDAELTADLIGDYLFTDADFVNNLSATNRNVFQKIYDEVKYLIKVATAGSKEARELAKVKRAFDKAYRESGKVSGDTKYSISDSDGKQLTKEQGEYFKDSKMRDENGNLKVMYHGSQDAGFHEFDASMSDDGASFFFVDRNDVAASYSGTSETYEAQSIRTAEDMNRFMESIDAEGYEVIEKDGKFVLLYEGERVADSSTAKGIYDEFCWYEGVGQGDANYKVYLNLTNPLEIDAKGRPWNKIDAEFSQEVYDKYQSLTAEEKDALVDLAEWEDFRMFNSEIQEARGDALASAYAKMGDDCNIYDLFSVAADSFSEESMRENARKYLKTRDFAARAKEQGYDGVIFKNIVDNGGYSNGSEGASTVAIAFDSEQIKSVANEKPTKDPDIRYSLSEDSEGRELSNAVKTRFGKSKVLDENGSLKVVYHGTATGEFSVFDKSKGSVEGDFGSGFYFTDNEADVSEHYEGGGPDFDNKVARRAEQIESEEEIDYDEAEERARKELYKGAHKFEVYLNIENPAIVGETVLFDNESYMEQYNEEDYDDYDDYIGDVEQLLADDVENIIYDVERNTGAYSTDGLADVLYNAYYDGGIGIEELKTKINDLYLEDENGNMIGNEVTRQIIESLGYDGIIDPTVSGKWNMDIEEGTTHYIVFKPNQIKAVTNQNPTDNPDIHRSISRVGETPKKHGRYHIKGEDVRYNDIAPVGETVSTTETPTETPTAPKERRLAWYNRWGEKVSDVPVMEDIAPSEPSLPQLREELDRVAQQAQEAMNAGDAEALNALGQRYEDINRQIQSMEAEDSARVSSISDADAPPVVDAPYQNEGVTPADPMAERDPAKVGNPKVKAYMYENPEVKPFFQEEANRLLGELDRSEKAQTYYNGWIKQDMSYEFAQDIPEVYRTKRNASQSIVTLRDKYNLSYDDIRKGLNALIEDHGAENIAAAKKIEFEINDRLMDGYTDESGYEIPANQEYRNMLIEKQIEPYSAEMRRSFFESVGATNIAPVKAMDNIAPVGDTVKKGEIPGQQTMLAETIRPQRQSNEPRMARVKDGDTSHDGKERKWYGTSTSSEAVGGLVTPEDIPDDVRYYQVKPNKQTLATANARLASDGYAKSREYFEGRMSAKKLTVEDIALGERLIQEAAKAGDAKAVRDLIIDVSILGTELGQRVQALSIIRRLTPEGQLKALHRTIDRAKAKGDKAFDGVELTEEMAKTITDTIKEDGTFDQAELNAAVEDVKQQIADQMSTSALDYINAWRYLAMLGNPKTHIRNIVSNVAMYGTRAVKNVVARTVEGMFLHNAKPKLNQSKPADIAPTHARTKTWARSTEAVKEFAKKTTKDMATVIMGENKYSEAGSIKEKRNVFKTRVGNALNNVNTAAMEWEDAIFSKSVYRRTLQEYLTANGVKTEADIQNNPALIEKAKEYALDESRRATFRQDSYLANKIQEVEQKNPIYGIAIGSTLPFKRTPINIAKAGISYSPLGFARNIYDAVQVKRGNMDASEAIDHLAQTLTGTSLTLIGFALANSGILNGAGDDDKEGKYDYQLGEQSYSFNFNGNTFSLSWLSPVAMPLFVGANAYEKLVEKSEWDADVVVDTLAQTLDPLSEMSFLSSLDDVLSSYDSGIEKFMGMGKSMVQNYATQFIPTLSSQIAATADDVKRSTKASGTSGFEAGDGFLRQMAYKIPGLRNKLEPTTDIWGNEYKQTENVFARAFESFLSPANKRDGISTAVDEELKSLYRETGDATLIPSIPYDYTNYKGAKYDMSAEEYTTYKQTYGQTALDLMEQLFATNTYRSATAEERADMVSRVYDYARDAAKLEYFAGIDLDYTNAEEDDKEVFKENPIKGAIEADLPVDEYVFSVEYPEKYKFFNENGITYETYKAADEDGKRAYTWAYENPGKFTMSKAISDDFMEYYGYKSDMSDFNAKDKNGESVSGLKKERVIEYVNGLNLDYGQKIILFRSMYDSKEDQKAYNQDIVDYLNEREDISYAEMETILKELGFEVDSEGNISW